MTDRDLQKASSISTCDEFEDRLTDILCTDPLDLQSFFESHGHLHQCAACRDLVESLLAGTQIPACPQPLVAAALAEVSARRARNRRLGLTLGISAAAAMAILSAALFFSPLHGTPTSDNFELVLLPDLAGEHPTAALMSGSSTAVRVHTLLSSRDRSLKLGLSAGTVLEAPRLGEDAVVLLLRSGLLAVDLDHERHLPLTVTLGDIMVRVTGTVLFVDAVVGRAGVLEGSIEVQGVQGEAIRVRAGEQLEFSTSTLKPLDDEIRRGVRELLGEAPAVATAAPMESADGVSSDAPSDETVSAEKDHGATTDPTAKTGISPRVGKSDYPRPATKAATAPEASTSAVETPSLNLLAEARRCRAARDWSCAIENYELAITQLAGSNEALVAIVSLAELELEQLGKPEAALAHYSEYLSKSPRGVLAPEAMYGKCRALGTLGRIGEEKISLQTLIDTYPESPYARSARSRLDYLLSH